MMQIDIPPMTSVEEAASMMMRLAVQHNTTVEATFNGVLLCAQPDDTPKNVVDVYYSAMYDRATSVRAADMTLRDHFAGMVMAAIVANTLAIYREWSKEDDIQHGYDDEIKWHDAKEAYRVADAMIEARQKGVVQ